ncbi:hypothetical protein Pd630_LPD03549 [Rhodococcus opacus PD630]|nr:hypothetical protein Pd630_LPD03549 [Rhodococcus opacus PD630]
MCDESAGFLYSCRALRMPGTGARGRSSVEAHRDPSPTEPVAAPERGLIVRLRIHL